MEKIQISLRMAIVVVVVVVVVAAMIGVVFLTWIIISTTEWRGALTSILFIFPALNYKLVYFS